MRFSPIASECSRRTFKISVSRPTSRQGQLTHLPAVSGFKVLSTSACNLPGTVSGARQSLANCSNPTGETFIMKTLTTTKLLLATALIASSAGVFAQSSGTAGTSTSPGMGSNQPATGVGVTPQTANDANSQAVPRSDTGTVVRTSPNAVDSTRNATGMTGTTGMSNDSGTTTRTARADRN